MPRHYCDSAYGDERPLSPLAGDVQRGRRSRRAVCDAQRPSVTRSDLVAKYWDLQQWMCTRYMPVLQALDALCLRTLEGSLDCKGAQGINRVQVMRVRQLQPLICRLRMERNDPAQSITSEDFEWLKAMNRKLGPFLAEFDESAIRKLGRAAPR